MGAREKFQVRQDPRWPDAHIKLKRLFIERCPPDMTQEKFGAEYGLGSQGMVWQYLNGYTPLNIEAAAKFAHGLRCTIKDISPEMDKVMRARILPAMGLAAWGKVTLAALVFLGLQLAPPSEAAILHNPNYRHNHTHVIDFIYIMRSSWFHRTRAYITSAIRNLWLGLSPA